MAHIGALIATDIEAYLTQHQHKSLLRFITCGTVDDGKSTLIGRLLYDSKMIFEDQLAALEADSKTVGTQGGEIDFALLVDGLAAEREQGITIDVAYRFFSTDKRKFIVADTPGHEQYTRNMVTGASTADLAVILIDARKGVLTQTRRHSYPRQADGHPPRRAGRQQDGSGRLHARRASTRSSPITRTSPPSIGLEDVLAIPISGLKGDNITARSAGHALVSRARADGASGDGRDRRARGSQRGPFRMPVQWVNRPNLDFRGFAGQIASGTSSPATRSACCPSGKTSTVARIVTADGDLEEAVAGQSVTLTLADEIDCSRGDVHRRGRAIRPRPPTSSRRRSCGWPTSICCPAGPIG